MKPPKSVKVGPFEYSIEIGGSAWIEMVERSGSEGSCGLHSMEQLRIGIKGQLAKRQLMATLVHELLHACMVVSGRPLDDEDEEKVVGAIEVPLLAVLRDNPDLIAFLTS